MTIFFLIFFGPVRVRRRALRRVRPRAGPPANEKADGCLAHLLGRARAYNNTCLLRAQQCLFAKRICCAAAREWGSVSRAQGKNKCACVKTYGPATAKSRARGTAHSSCGEGVGRERERRGSARGEQRGRFRAVAAPRFTSNAPLRRGSLRGSTTPCPKTRRFAQCPARVVVLCARWRGCERTRENGAAAGKLLQRWARGCATHRVRSVLRRVRVPLVRYVRLAVVGRGRGGRGVAAAVERARSAGRGGGPQRRGAGHSNGRSRRAAKKGAKEARNEQQCTSHLYQMALAAPFAGRFHFWVGGLGGGYTPREMRCVAPRRPTQPLP